MLDNSSTHKSPNISAGWPPTRAFTCTPPPTGSSWLNLVERWFAG